MQPYYFVYYWSQYLSMGLTAFITCVMLKKHFKRPRPVPKNLPKRIFNIRRNEIDCSWPSGDTAQASIFAIYILLIQPFIFEKIPGGQITLAIWILHVAFGRIYFHCHYIGDTVGGFIVAWFVAHANSIVTHLLV